MTTGPFRGWLKTSLTEYPGRVSTVLFTGGCNLRCPFCHNPELALGPETLPSYEAEEVLTWIRARRPLVSAVVVTGGEPAIHPWLGGFLSSARSLGMATAVATNGSFPGELGELFRGGLVDRVAMDVKTNLEPTAYAAATGSADPELVAKVRSSLRALMESGLDYELRCTVVPRFHTTESLLRLAEELRGARHLVFQELSSAHCMDPSLEGGPPFPYGELERVCARAAGLVERCSVRASPWSRLEPPGPGTENRSRFPSA